MSSRDFATELLESYIVDNHLTPDDRLPSERELCQLWNLNRTTLRNAIQRLVDDGVLYSRMGSGTYVAHPKMIRNLQDVYGFSAAVRAQGRIPSSRLVWEQLQEADKTTSRRLHVPLGTQIYAIQRVRLIDEMPCSIETTHINTLLCPGIQNHDFGSEALFDVLHDEYGVQAMSGDEKLTVTTLDSVEAELLDVEEGHTAFFQSGVIVDAQDQPIEYFKNVVLSERIRFATELTNEAKKTPQVGERA